MLKELDDYDWGEAFGYAGEEDMCASWQDELGCRPRLTIAEPNCSDAKFAREDVTEILHMHEGENDGAAWMIIGKLHDGRYFYLEAWCDYTGWDCQAGGRAWVATQLPNLLAFGVTQSAQDVFGLNRGSV